MLWPDVSIPELVETIPAHDIDNPEVVEAISEKVEAISKLDIISSHPVTIPQLDDVISKLVEATSAIAWLHLLFTFPVSVLLVGSVAFNRAIPGGKKRSIPFLFKEAIESLLQVAETISIDVR